MIKNIKDSVMKKKILLKFQLPSSNSVDMVMFQSLWKKIFSEFIHCSVSDQTVKAPPSLGQLNTLHWNNPLLRQKYVFSSGGDKLL